MVGRQYGWVKIISPEKRWSKSWNHCYVLTQCTGCGAIQWQELTNLTSGKSKGCQHCSQPRQIPRWLDRRLTEAKQRCTNPKDPEYANYGGRGISFNFSSVLEAGLYLIDTFGLPDRALDIDRINTNGNYEKGNIRFVTRQKNNLNKRTTVLTRFEQIYWPYSYPVVIRKLSSGETRDEIIQDAETAVFEKRKNWRLILARLEFMTYEMPEDIIVLPYRDASSTTVDMAAV
jgi:ferritin-like protein